MHDPHALPGTDVVVDGIRLHVVEHGRGRPLLLLHGIPTSSYLWHDVARNLEHAYRCVMPDLIGLGDSERADNDAAYALEAQARRLLGLLDALGIQTVAVVGHDVGAAVAVHLAALAPDRVEALILVSARCRPGMAEPSRLAGVTTRLPRELRAALGRGALGVLRRRRTLALAALIRALGREASTVEADHYLTPLLSREGCAGLVQLLAAMDLDGAHAALASLGPVPALVLYGELDPATPSGEGVWLARALPGSACVQIADAGRLVPSERPERVAEEIAGFLAELASTARVAGQSAVQ